MRKTILTIALLIFPLAVHAQPLPEDQRTEEAEIWLARALVAEAGWSQPDHAAIAWVLQKRWRAYQAGRDADWGFVEQIKAYCKGVSTNTRRKWVLTLSPDGTEPEGWPADVLWSNYEPHWQRTLRFVRAWFAGRVPDPCPTATHWGGPMDRRRAATAPVNCGMTANIFYAVTSAREH